MPSRPVAIRVANLVPPSRNKKARREAGLVGREPILVGSVKRGTRHKKLMRPHAGQDLDLTDEQAAALLRELDHTIAGDRYFLSPRIRTLTAIRDKLRPPPVRGPLPPLKVYAPPRAKARQRRR